MSEEVLKAEEAEVIETEAELANSDEAALNKVAVESNDASAPTDTEVVAEEAPAEVSEEVVA